MAHLSITKNTNRLQTMPNGVFANIVSYLPRRERTLPVHNDNNNGIRIPEVIIPLEKMAGTNAIFTNVHKAASDINDPTVTLVEKIALISNPEIPNDIRKIPLKKDDIVLSIHALRQTDISFTPEEIESILSHSDRGIVGTLIENTSVELSNAQIQEQWDKNKPFIRAMIVKSGRSEQLDISATDKIKYDPNNHAARMLSHPNAPVPYSLPTIGENPQEIMNIRQEEAEIRLASDEAHAIGSAITIKNCLDMARETYRISGRNVNILNMPLSEGQCERVLSNMARIIVRDDNLPLANAPVELINAMQNRELMTQQQLQRALDNPLTHDAARRYQERLQR